MKVKLPTFADFTVNHYSYIRAKDKNKKKRPACHVKPKLILLNAACQKKKRKKKEKEGRNDRRHKGRKDERMLEERYTYLKNDSSKSYYLCVFAQTREAYDRSNLQRQLIFSGARSIVIDKHLALKGNNFSVSVLKQSFKLS